MNYNGYRFFVGGMELPYAPPELTFKMGSNNKTVELISGEETTIIKSPKLTEIEFEIELPRGRQYPFANKLVEADIFLEHFEKIMVSKQPTELLIIRPNRTFYKRVETSSNGTSRERISSVKSNDNKLMVTLEGYEQKESAENAYDVTVSLKFKLYRKQTTIKSEIMVDGTTGTPQQVTPVVKPTTDENKSYTVKNGDTLWSIARSHYGTANQNLVNKIYEANKVIIEETARNHGKSSSSCGHWIYTGTKLVIPSV